jgi:G6PDH family F420-dependent oxidoreductase
VNGGRRSRSAELIRALWRGETVTHSGHVTVEDAKLYSLPSHPPRLAVAAISEQTAHWAGTWADCLITTGRPRARMKRMIDAFRGDGGEHKTVLVQHGLSWARSPEQAMRNAQEQWRFSALAGDVLWLLRTPAEFAAASEFVTGDDLARTLRISADLDQHTGWIQEYAELGVDEVYCFNVGKNQAEFIDNFGQRVLPQLKTADQPATVLQGARSDVRP